ncbi:hypothetical protein QBC47DRAFT_352946 [Echria macrotheca]|uniref:Uncharacterized protein n=1 Tax=Echria macrotheca TaxID=438768 RepID=A0AAJ0F733_9PEZI|nr:hypothetical protein QBC47DRAFT_352946 [Echria macrotheca]
MVPVLNLVEPVDPELQQSTPSDGSEDDDVYADQDDVQSLMQPAISPIATRLTSPRTPAAEKAAAMDKLPGGGLFDVLDEQEPMPPLAPLMQDPGHQYPTGESPVVQPSLPTADLPAPWQAGPKRFSVDPSSSRTGSMSNAFQSRAHRSSTISENALRRLSKALPSISIPTGLIPNISTPSFLSSFGASFQRDGQTAPQPQFQHPARISSPSSGLVAQPEVTADPSARRDSRTPALRKSTSDDSLLYHSLSRVSSFGDDERFAHVREQVNSRLKAIKDSWDGPSFKMPQFPSMFFLYVPQPKPSTDTGPNGSQTGAVPVGQRVQHGNTSPLSSALDMLTGDVVILGGYRGSILRSAEPPHRQLWVPVKVGLKIRKVNMEVGLEPEDEEAMEKHIFASGMLQNIGPVDISKRLFKKARECGNARSGKLRVHDYGYDWRLSPHLLSRKLIEFLEKLPSNQPDVPETSRGALVIAHSLGGLITRHAVNQRPELFSGVVYAGVPQRCINVLGPLRNGDAVLLNEKVLTAQVNLSLRTTFAFLPEDGFCFIDKETKEEYPIDFYNVDDWVKYRLSPCVSGPPLPALSRSNTFSSLLSLSDSLPNLPLRGRSNSHQQKRSDSDITQRGSLGTRERGVGAAVASTGSVPSQPNSTATGSPTGTAPGSAAQGRYVAYLRRTLAEIKRFRAELAHNPKHQEANAYPPLAVIYGKDVPTVYAARVAGREGIACADAYDDLVFRGGDGVVLARESMLPAGYELVRDGRICTDRGHISLLGDHNAVGRALEAVVRGRRKGIGLGSRGAEQD